MSSKIVRDVDTHRWHAQTKLANLGMELAQGHLAGEDLEEKEKQGTSIIRLLKALDQSAFLTNEELENLLYCLQEVAGLNSILPAAPSLDPRTQPTIAVGGTGPVGPAGPTGPDGADNVLVSSDPAFDNMTVTPVGGGGITDYQLGYNPYVAPIAAMVIDNGQLKEIGALTTVNFTTSYVAGREAITGTTITTPNGFTWTTNPQSFADSALIILSRTLRSYTARVTDGTTPDTDSEIVTFLFPLFSGSDDAVLVGATVYTNLNKLVQDISTSWEIPLSFTDDYGYFAFDDAYDDSAIIIRDQNGLDVTSEWTKYAIIVDSGTFHDGGGGTDWTKAYSVYRTTVKTDISGTYTIENVTPS